MVTAGTQVKWLPTALRAPGPSNAARSHPTPVMAPFRPERNQTERFFCLFLCFLNKFIIVLYYYYYYYYFCFCFFV